MAQRNARLGRLLFGVYALCYVAFVVTNAFAAETMEQQPLAGLNLALLSGFGLILLALLLALVYGVVARDTPAGGEDEVAA